MASPGRNVWAEGPGQAWQLARTADTLAEQSAGSLLTPAQAIDR
jgi:hypothetical protein